MTLLAVIRIALLASIFLIVLALGLTYDGRDAPWHPKATVRVLLAMFVVMPLVAVVMGMTLSLRPAVRVALITMALSPVPPFLPKKQLAAGGAPAKVVRLLVVASLLSVVLIPVAVPLIARLFGLQASVQPAPILVVVGATVLLPLLLGLLMHRFAPGFSQRIADPAGKVGGGLLVLAMVPVLIVMAPEMWSLVGSGTLVAIVVFLVIGLVTGHFLAGGDPRDRTVLALSTASRHPGVALVIASAAVPETEGVLPALLLYLLLAGPLSGVYLAIRRRREGSDHATAPAEAGR